MLQKCSILKVAGLFFTEPTKSHYLMEISRKSNIAHTSVKKHLNKLEKEKIIKKLIENKGSRKFPIYQSNFNEKEYKEFKKIYNLLKLKESGLIDFLKYNLTPQCIVLFGSYRRGSDIETSDIDLFVQCKSKDINLLKFEKILRRKINIQFSVNFRKYSEELKNNIINGIVLEGYLEAL